MRNRYIRWSVLILLSLVVLSIIGYFSLRNNIHAVIPGEVYRSAQLSSQRFEKLLQQKHIRAVLNLRGPNPQSSWYRNEMIITKNHHIDYESIPLSAYPKYFSVSMLRHLVHLLQVMRRPLLMHCEGGSDRTGLASAIVLLLQGKSYAVAEHQISFRYFVTSEKSVGKLVLPYYAAWLKHHHYKSSRQHFLQWVQDLRVRYLVKHA